MADIKTKKSVYEAAKTVKGGMNPAIRQARRTRRDYIKTKEYVTQRQESREETAENYAADEVSEKGMSAVRAVTAKAGEAGKKAVMKSREDIIRARAGKGTAEPPQGGTSGGMNPKGVSPKAGKPISKTPQQREAGAQVKRQTVKRSRKVTANTRNIHRARRTMRNTYRTRMVMGATREAAFTASFAIRRTLYSIAIAAKSLAAAGRSFATAIAAGGWIAVVILTIIIVLASAVTFFGNTKSNTYTPVSAEVETYEPQIKAYAERFGIAEYAELIKAVMMAESQGKGVDLMGVAAKKDIEIKSRQQSIEEGIKLLAACLNAENVQHPVDMVKIRLALARYSPEDEDYASEVLKYYPFGRFSFSSGDSAIVEVAASQLGNKGGKPYWSWYGFNGRVAWCACFVSWCANECGYLDEGIIPRFSVVSDGMDWFKERNQWQGKNYEPAAGDIIFFDWENDGDFDHVGIVEKCEGGLVYTIEGNSGDACCRLVYTVGNPEIEGYGVPLYQ